MSNTRLSICVVSLALAACSMPSPGPDPGVGANPRLPPPDPQVLPTVDVAKAIGWPQGATPRPAPGLAVIAFATGLDHPRWVYALPNGDVLVAESNAPPRPEDGKGLKAKVMKLFMKKAGAGTPSANRITLLRDTDGDGIAETRTIFLEGLNSPFGMVLVGDTCISRTPTRSCACRTARAPRASPRRRRRWLICRQARATITGPRT